MGQAQSKEYEEALAQFREEHCKDLFADPSSPTSSRNYVDRLVKSKDRVINEILPALEDPEGFGWSACLITLETWESIKAKLEYMCKSWSMSVAQMPPEAAFVITKKEKSSFVNLEWALAREHQGVIWCNERSDLRQFVSQHQFGSGPPEMAAYKAIYALHKCSKKRSWTTDKDFGEVLGDYEVKEGEDL